VESRSKDKEFYGCAKDVHMGVTFIAFANKEWNKLEGDRPAEVIGLVCIRSLGAFLSMRSFCPSFFVLYN
jgi:hypothetical protein